MSDLLRLKNPQAGVPGGCSFFVHQTNWTAYDQTLSGLKTQVIDHLLGNGIAVAENIDQVIEDQICRRLQASGQGLVCREQTTPPQQQGAKSRGRCCS